MLTSSFQNYFYIIL